MAEPGSKTDILQYVGLLIKSYRYDEPVLVRSDDVADELDQLFVYIQEYVED